MKKNEYISPSLEVTFIKTNIQILAGSPQGTNIAGLGISDQAAPNDMEGRSRSKTVWDDEEEEEEY